MVSYYSLSRKGWTHLLVSAHRLIDTSLNTCMLRLAGLERCVCVALAALLAGCSGPAGAPAADQAPPASAPPQSSAQAALGCANFTAGLVDGGAASAEARRSDGVVGSASAEVEQPQELRVSPAGQPRGVAAAEPCSGFDVGSGCGSQPRTVSRCELRQQLARVSGCYPAARPSRGMLRQVLSYFGMPFGMHDVGEGLAQQAA